MKHKNKMIAVIFIIWAMNVQTTVAAESLSTGVDQLVRAQLWHQGIVETGENTANSFKSDVNYPEELTLAVELLDQEKR